MNKNDKNRRRDFIKVTSPNANDKDVELSVHFQCQGEKPFKNGISKCQGWKRLSKKQSNNGQIDVFEAYKTGIKSGLMFGR
jgi:hypothetical protein